MSIVKVYGADCCGQLRNADDIVGVDTAVDLFDNLRSYKTSMFPERTQVHYCLDCYREQVLIPTENESPRAKDAGAYSMQLEQYSFMFRKKVVNNWHECRFFGNKKKVRK